MSKTSEKYDAGAARLEKIGALLDGGAADDDPRIIELLQEYSDWLNAWLDEHDYELGRDEDGVLYLEHRATGKRIVSGDVAA